MPSQIFPARFIGWKLMLFALLSLFSVLSGCSEKLSKPETDEPAKRALAEGISVEKAADYFSYRGEVPNFFDGMDSISISTGARLPDPLLAIDKDSQTVTRPAARVTSVPLNKSETIGRNTWMVWCAGNEGFWDWLATDSLGFIDLRKLVDSRKRNNRFRDAGLINEPGMARTVVADEFGVWLDVPQDSKIRRWREHFLEQSFDRIGTGSHKSQIGLKRRDLLQRSDSSSAVSRGDELCVLPRIVSSIETARRYELSAVGEHIRQHRGAISEHASDGWRTIDA